MIIRCEFLTSRYVAKETHYNPEWPPHPARLFYALVSSLYAFITEGDERGNPSERKALRWLAGLGHPEIACAPLRKIGSRKVVTHHVPANDPDPITAKNLESNRKPDHLPEHRRKSERTFPTLLLSDASNTVYYYWPNVEGREFAQRRTSLEALFERVSYLGHSSSLVALSFVSELHENPQVMRWVPTPDATAGHALRGFTTGLLELLDEVYLPNEYSQQNYRLPHVSVTYVEAESKEVEKDRVATSCFGEKWVVYRFPEWARVPMNAVLGLTTNLKSEA